MGRRQTIASEWLIVTAPPDPALWRAIRRLKRGTGLLLLCRLPASQKRRLRHLAQLRSLQVVAEGPRTAARVHDARELLPALLRCVPLILVSPLFETGSHPDWAPLPRMRAAALARLAHRRAIALGGMSGKRYAKIAPLGFIGWAGISAFRT